jgi:hypothetical protein
LILLHANKYKLQKAKITISPASGPVGIETQEEAGGATTEKRTGILTL